MMKRCMVVLLLFVSVVAQGQQMEGTAWQNGDLFFVAHDTAGVVTLEGGTLHEGGYGLQLKRTGTDKFMLMPGEWLPQISIDNSRNWTLEHCADGQNLLVGRNANGLVTGVLVQMDHRAMTTEEAWARFRATVIRNYRLLYAGNYVNSKGQRMTVSPDGIIVTDNGATDYSVLFCLDLPAGGIVYNDSVRRLLVPDSTSAEAYAAHFVADGDLLLQDSLTETWQRQPVMINMGESGEQFSCLWPQPFSMLLTHGLLSPLPTEVLDKMQDETDRYTRACARTPGRHGLHLADRIFRQNKELLKAELEYRHRPME